MDVPTPAAPKNDEHFSEKKVFANWIFLAQKYLPYHRILRGEFLTQNSK